MKSILPFKALAIIAATGALSSACRASTQLNLEFTPTGAGKSVSIGLLSYLPSNNAAISKKPVQSGAIHPMVTVRFSTGKSAEPLLSAATEGKVIPSLTVTVHIETGAVHITRTSIYTNVTLGKVENFASDAKERVLSFTYEKVENTQKDN